MSGRGLSILSAGFTIRIRKFIRGRNQEGRCVERAVHAGWAIRLSGFLTISLRATRRIGWGHGTTGGR